MKGERDSPGPAVNVEIIAAVVLAAIATIFLVFAGEGVRDWLMPVTLSYVLIAAAAYLLVRGLLGRGERVPIVPAVLRGKRSRIDVLIFAALAVAYVALLRPLGFWLVSLPMLVLGSLFLSPSHDRRTVVTAVLAACAVCVVFYVVFGYVLYVPLPRGWSGF